MPVLLELAEPKISDAVLDVATGPGNTAFALADYVQSVIGVDIAPRMLEQAQLRADTERKTNIIFQEASADLTADSSQAVMIVAWRRY